MKTNKAIRYIAGCAAIGLASSLSGCTDSFLEQDPLSFYEPGVTYTTESGLRAALAICDRHLQYMFFSNGNDNNQSMNSSYIMTDLALYGKTDAGGNFQDDFDAKLTPTSGMYGGYNDFNYMQLIYDECWNGVLYANTVLSYIDDVSGLSDEVKNAYKGRAYFHRAYRYYILSLHFGNVPLITKVISSPKQDYLSASQQAIFDMLVHDLEFAVGNVPALKDTPMLGSVNQEACMQLLIKCYLAVGEFAKAEAMATDLIDNHGLRLMTEPFGNDIKSGEPDTWSITRNVLWDLHRGENVVNAANTETIMPILNFNDENFINHANLRVHAPNWQSTALRDPDGMSRPIKNIARSNGEYSASLDWVRVMGRGQGMMRTSPYFHNQLWTVDGEYDEQDLRHNREVGNWMEMTDLKYNDPKSKHYGENLTLYAPEDVYDDKGEKIVSKGDLLCSDTIRCWFPFPLYKLYVLDAAAEASVNQDNFKGASSGANANVYLFRLAETYLLRAEARFYQGKSTMAAQDVNVIRRRANAKKMFADVTIGNIADERGRELFFEEWRHAELVRMSWCLARSGQPDEWGETYDLATWNKQEGTDLNGGSYWFKRATRCNLFNQGPVVSNSVALNYKVNKHNLYWPIPYSSIAANNGAPLMQNFGYEGYDASTPMWEKWEDAVAAE